MWQGRSGSSVCQGGNRPCQCLQKPASLAADMSCIRPVRPWLKSSAGPMGPAWSSPPHWPTQKGQTLVPALPPYPRNMILQQVYTGRTRIARDPSRAGQEESLTAPRAHSHGSTRQVLDHQLRAAAVKVLRDPLLPCHTWRPSSPACKLHPCVRLLNCLHNVLITAHRERGGDMQQLCGLGPRLWEGLYGSVPITQCHKQL